MTIKEGALVKAWNDNPSDYYVGFYYEHSSTGSHSARDPNCIRSTGCFSVMCFDNAIEIPQELAKALEELGNE